MVWWWLWPQSCGRCSHGMVAAVWHGLVVVVAVTLLLWLQHGGHGQSVVVAVWFDGGYGCRVVVVAVMWFSGGCGCGVVVAVGCCCSCGMVFGIVEVAVFLAVGHILFLLCQFDCYCFCCFLHVVLFLFPWNCCC